jgi:hypothetical protein
MKISPTKSIYGLEKVNCPKGTVPIRRVTKDDLIRDKYLSNDGVETQNGFRTHVSLLIYTTEFIYDYITYNGLVKITQIFIQ